MGIVQFFKEGFTSHKASGFKILLSVIAVVVFLFTGSAYVTSQHIQDEAATTSQNAVANHTQTLNEIESAVNQLKASNEADHTATIKYINCVLVGLTEAGANGTPGSALGIYQTCLANSQIPAGTQ